MKAELAKRFLSEQMKWTDEKAAEEFARLELMIGYKYDHYQGFQPGSRFYVALLGWLGQFKSDDERARAYEFFKKDLVFVSQREMHHLVSLLMPIVDRTIRHNVCQQMGIPMYQTWLLPDAKAEVRRQRRCTLFVGLSDGARIDVFRRYNEDIISNEQVVAATEISQAKWDELVKDLRKSMKDMGVPNPETAQFERYCLVDDFTGSGSSLIREKDGAWKGKIKRFCDNYGKLHPCENSKPWPVQVHHHLASAKAADQIKKHLDDFSKTESRFDFTPTYSYKLPPGIVVSDASESTLTSLITKYYDPAIADDHTGKDIWYGYKQSGLPLILDHNTPNNSVALLWAQSPADSESTVPMKPLFQRRKRHSSHG